MANNLTAKQEAFCHEYTVDMNATQAAIRSGYSKRSAEVQGVRLLKNVKVSVYVSDLMAKRNKSADVNAKRILDALWTNHTLALADRQYSNSNRSLELLGKSQRLFVDRIEQTNTYQSMSDTELDAAIKQAEQDITH